MGHRKSPALGLESGGREKNIALWLSLSPSVICQVLCILRLFATYYPSARIPSHFLVGFRLVLPPPHSVQLRIIFWGMLSQITSTTLYIHACP